MRNKVMKREARLRQIMLVFAVDIQSGHNGRKTLNDIARAIEVATSSKLRDMVTELIGQGLLTYDVEPMPGVVGKRFIYYPTPEFNTATGKPHRAPRTIKFRTKKNGQTAIWEEIIT